MHGKRVDVYAYIRNKDKQLVDKYVPTHTISLYSKCGHLPNCILDMHLYIQDTFIFRDINYMY